MSAEVFLFSYVSVSVNNSPALRDKIQNNQLNLRLFLIHRTEAITARLTRRRLWTLKSVLMGKYKILVVYFLANNRVEDIRAQHTHTHTHTLIISSQNSFSTILRDCACMCVQHRLLQKEKLTIRHNNSSTLLHVFWAAQFQSQLKSKSSVQKFSGFTLNFLERMIKREPT